MLVGGVIPLHIITYRHGAMLYVCNDDIGNLCEYYKTTPKKNSKIFLGKQKSKSS